MRLATLLLCFALYAGTAHAQNCSNSTTGVIVDFSSVTVDPLGTTAQACLQLQGDTSQNVGSVFIDFLFNNAALNYTGFTATAGSPFNSAPYSTNVLDPAGCGTPANNLCIDIESTIAIGPEAFPSPASPFEYICVDFTITDDTQTAMFDLNWSTFNNAAFTPCPDVDFGANDAPLGTPLPVELTQFDAVSEGESVRLVWETATELNNAGFFVERSASDVASEQVAGSEWVELGFVEGAGTTDEARSYDYRVTGLQPGTYQFRLRQVDFDGAFEYSPIVEATAEMPEAFRLSAPYPNPFNPRASFTLAVAAEQRVRIVAYDVLGRPARVLYDANTPAQRTLTLHFDAADLPSGPYILRAEGETFVAAQRVTLLR
ncbi:MAG: hypothetical protein AAGI08_06105 [Bacteroidota bacterium]